MTKLSGVTLGTIAIATLIAIIAHPAAAQRETGEQLRRHVDYVDTAAVRDARKYLIRYRGVGTTVFTSPDEQTNYVLVRRVVNSEVERHARWDDLIIVRGGSGALVVGDRAKGETFRAPGEYRGGTLVSPRTLVIHNGDVVRVPAGMPHSFEVNKDAPLEYLLVKIRRPELPLR